LPHIQVSYLKREGGFMHDAISPEECISIAVIQKLSDKACFDQMKLHQGDILFFDDNKAYNFMSNNKIEVAIISLSEQYHSALYQRLLISLGHYIDDTQAVFSHKLTQVLKEINNKDGALITIEDELINILSSLLTEQTPLKPKLTKGEKIALAIRDEVYHHMDGHISIAYLAKKYQVSEQTLQNSFKSLFGFTPKLFLRLLKLNLVHHDLKHNTSSCSVLKIATKWGFMHMGHFGRYYTDLFGEHPSTTLCASYPQEKSMSNACTSRQEEV
jgi:AraC-like DNA-binding protein